MIICALRLIANDYLFCIYFRHRRAGQQGFNGIRCENARAYRHQDNQNIREGFGQDRFRRNERDKKQILDPTKAEGQTDHI
mgnify:CR=1 FL=1